MANVMDRITVRLYYGDEADEKVGKYLGQFDSAARGEKHSRVKELLYLGLQALRGDIDGSGPGLIEIRGVIREELSLHNPLLDKEVISQAVVEALQSVGVREDLGREPDLTLSDIREVVVSVVAAELDRREVYSGQIERRNGSEADQEIGRMSGDLLIE